MRHLKYFLKKLTAYIIKSLSKEGFKAGFVRSMTCKFCIFPYYSVCILNLLNYAYII